MFTDHQNEERGRDVLGTGGHGLETHVRGGKGGEMPIVGDYFFLAKRTRSWPAKSFRIFWES